MPLKTGRSVEAAMTTITVPESQANLVDLIHQLSPGDEVLIIENDRPVARFSIAASATQVVTTSGKRDWWVALQEIEQSQKLRGFIGTVSDIDRDDQGIRRPTERKF
jgi:antitoxin (DNA-binding transcriptional repressor) of toxin-antitoxin stability system